MGRKLEHDSLLLELSSWNLSSLQPLYVVSGDEPLLMVEAADAVRAAANRLAYSDRSRYTLDARSDWSDVLGSTQNVSLFGDKKLIDLSLPTGKPGKAGAQAIIQLGDMIASGSLIDASILLQLPRLDKATRNTKWCQALEQHATWTELTKVSRSALPHWISQRLNRQSQSLSSESLGWMTDKVEGNLLAAFQEIQKLGLLYPSGVITQEQLEHAILNVARYSVFDLRDAMLSGQAARALHILDGLEAEGESPVLMLWAVGEEIRLLARLAQAKSQHQDINPLMRQNRVFGPREQLMRRALNTISPASWPAAMLHVHELDKLIKGLKSDGRLHQPWEELRRLTLRIAVAAQSGAR